MAMMTSYWTIMRLDKHFWRPIAGGYWVGTWDRTTRYFTTEELGDTKYNVVWINYSDTLVPAIKEGEDIHELTWEPGGI